MATSCSPQSMFPPLPVLSNLRRRYAPLGDLTSNITEAGLGEQHTKRVAKQVGFANGVARQSPADSCLA